MIRIKHSLIGVVASCVASVALADPEKTTSAIGAGASKNREERGHSHVNVPPGHLPPPGECRIWFPDRRAGHQPPPGACRELSRKVPRGAVLAEGG
jgi:hypothetical protein